MVQGKEIKKYNIFLNFILKKARLYSNASVLPLSYKLINQYNFLFFYQMEERSSFHLFP